MGTDIDGWIECSFAKTIGFDMWRPAIKLGFLYLGRDYDVFASLFGVRNTEGGRLIGDVIEAETQENGVLYFRRLVTPSSWLHWQWLLSKVTVESPTFATLKAAIEEQGGKWE